VEKSFIYATASLMSFGRPPDHAFTLYHIDRPVVPKIGVWLNVAIGGINPRLPATLVPHQF
jgi:hypothetical protein